MTTLKKSFRVGVAQMTSTDDIEKNCEQMLQLLADTKDLSLVDLVVFPENALYLRLDKNSQIPGLDLQAECFKLLAESAVHHQVSLLVGSAPIAEPSGKLSNATVWIHANGQVEVVYRKIHLFDVDVQGQPPVRESDSFVPGAQTQVIEIHGWRLGLSICYDLRFAELYHRYAKQGVDVILVPSAFLVPTGQAHWHVLLRARAIENQVYIVAPAQSGEHKSAKGIRRTFGHSLVVDPWGEILLDAKDDGPGIHFVELKRERLDWVKSQIPQSSHRRL